VTTGVARHFSVFVFLAPGVLCRGYVFPYLRKDMNIVLDKLDDHE